MRDVKKILDENARDLASQLGKVRTSVERIINLAEYRGQAVGIERVELDRMIELCEGYLDDINILFKSVAYLAQERREGKLYLNRKGQWCLAGVDIALRESDPMELLIEDEGVDTWQIGRVILDHTNELLYFLGEESRRYLLKQGLQAAVRLESITQATQKGACHGHHASN